MKNYDRNDIGLGIVLIIAISFSSIGLVIAINDPVENIGKHASELIAACESELPSNEHCIIVAVPK